MDIRKHINDIKSQINSRAGSDLERKKLEAELKAAQEMAQIKEVVIEKRLAFELASIEDSNNLHIDEHINESCPVEITQRIRDYPHPKNAYNNHKDVSEYMSKMPATAFGKYSQGNVRSGYVEPKPPVPVMKPEGNPFPMSDEVSYCENGLQDDIYEDGSYLRSGKGGRLQWKTLVSKFKKKLRLQRSGKP